MGRGFIFTETDSGTKEKAKIALRKTAQGLDAALITVAKQYWYRVWETARALCIQYGAVDTWSLYRDIRLIWVVEPYGGLYEVSVSSKGADITAQIKVGGTIINWKTGKLVDYAQAVHDGTRYQADRPFLTDAIALCEPFLRFLLERNIDKALSRFERDY